VSQVLHLTGPVIADGSEVLDEVWVLDGRLSTTPPAGADAARRIDGWVLPGLVDVHCHIGLGPDGAVTEREALEQGAADRDAGTLLVRDAGSPMDNRWVKDRADMPRLVRCARHLARPKRYLRHFARELDDVGDLPEAVAEEARAGDGWVKLVADWIDRSAGAEADLAPLWPEEVLREAVAAAHENGARVTAHTFSHEAVGPLLEAGIDALEHGTGMDGDQIVEAARRGVAVTPTLLQVAKFEQFAAQAEPKYPVYAAHMRRMHARRHEHVAHLYEAGVPLLMGSDAGGYIEHGSLPAELAEVARAGVPTAAVVAAASWEGRAYLRADGIADGASADVVVYEADPRRDITVLERPSAVILRGRLI